MRSAALYKQGKVLRFVLLRKREEIINCTAAKGQITDRNWFGQRYSKTANLFVDKSSNFKLSLKIKSYLNSAGFRNLIWASDR